jgi:primosomal protein N' (replication factor Y)
MVDSLFAKAPAHTVRVALPLPIDVLFEYAVPADLTDRALPGCRAFVTFSGKRQTALIVERVSRSDRAQPSGPLGSIEKLIDSSPVLSASLLAIVREAAADVLCPVGQALFTALPAGSGPRLVSELALSARGREALRSGAAQGLSRNVLAALGIRPATPTVLAKRVPGSAVAIRELESEGFLTRRERERAPVSRSPGPRLARPAPGMDVDAVCRGELRRAPAQAALLRRIAQEGEIETSSLAAEAAGSLSTLRTLVRRNLVEMHRSQVRRGSAETQPTRDTPPALTAEQEAALQPILESIRRGRSEQYLLHGVTGSGKTEVYLRAVAESLARGRQALVLVPEITLTHQIVERVRARFGDRCAVLHSGLPAAARFEQWQRLQRGDTPIAVGARSALFAPLEQLGVIVVDEEQDSAYKNQEGFRYHARDLARRRARAAGCPLLLGTATPALETRYAAEQGRIRRLVLSRRIAGRPLPAVQLVDLARERERLPRGRKLILSTPLRRALQEVLDSGGQSILFLNRRGFSTQIMCFQCGAAERCKDCDVALVYHAVGNRLRCHHCEYAVKPPERCSGCGAPDTALMGVGTQRIEEEVLSAFPGARVARLDRDTAQRRGYAEAVLRDLRDGRLDIMIGTQLVAKGHDFPGVQLVGVIAADLALHLPDFRAAERTFQLLTQVAGRAGRDRAPGRVILQTFVPDHYAIRPVTDHDYERFYQEELGHRAALGYPPYGRLAQMIVSGSDEDQTRTAARELCSLLSNSSSHAKVEVLGPAAAPLARLRGRFRFQILLKSGDPGAVLAAGRELSVAAGQLKRGLRATLDVDPVSML